MLENLICPDILPTIQKAERDSIFSLNSVLFQSYYA